ncbi:MAG: BlaI/MecI/CopY family transcriptional regulator [Planctomycetaceae bacterium]
MTRYRLTRYELELLSILWQIGEGTVQDVCDRLQRDLAYTTVMTTLNLLAIRKKVLVREKRGRAFVYRPIVTREEIAKTVLAELTDILFGNRLPELVLNLWSDRQSDGRVEAILRDAVERVRSLGPTADLVTTIPVSAPLIETQT